MAGMCPQYLAYWCPLQNGCPKTSQQTDIVEVIAPDEVFEQTSQQKETPYCIIAHNAASSTVVACAHMGITPPKIAVDFLKAQASNL